MASGPPHATGGAGRVDRRGIPDAARDPPPPSAVGFRFASNRPYDWRPDAGEGLLAEVGGAEERPLHGRRRGKEGELRSVRRTLRPAWGTRARTGKADRAHRRIGLQPIRHERAGNRRDAASATISAAAAFAVGVARAQDGRAVVGKRVAGAGGARRSLALRAAAITIGNTGLDPRAPHPKRLALRRGKGLHQDKRCPTGPQWRRAGPGPPSPDRWETRGIRALQGRSPPR